MGVTPPLNLRRHVRQHVVALSLAHLMADQAEDQPAAAVERGHPPSRPRRSVSVTATTAIGFEASDAPAAQEALAELRQRYGTVPPEEADVIVALGGDGFMLETLHRTLPSHRPCSGMD